MILVLLVKIDALTQGEMTFSCLYVVILSLILFCLHPHTTQCSFVAVTCLLPVFISHVILGITLSRHAFKSWHAENHKFFLFVLKDL